MTVLLENAKQINVTEFHGLTTAAEETKLPSGFSPNLANIWTDESPGSVQTAKGFALAGTAPTSNPIAFQFDFLKDDGTQIVLISDNRKVWVTRDFSTFTEIITGLNGDFQLRAAAARGKVWLTNGSDAVRTYNGTSVVVLDGTAGTPNVPHGKLITYYHERVFIGNISGSRASMRFTSLADTAGVEIAPDNAAAWPAINEIKVGDGDGEFMTGLKVYRTKLHMGKSTSIWRLEGNDEFSYFPLRTNATVGPRFQECIRELDGNLHYVGLHGVYEFNGDVSTRVSDNLNAQVPGAAFSISDIQQSEVNNRFWQQSSTAEFAAGTYSRNTDTSLAGVQLKPADSTQADFTAGVLKTNLTLAERPGFVQLTTTLTGASETNAAAGKPALLVPTGATGIIGNSSYITDGDLSLPAGFTTPGIEGSFNVPITTLEHLNVLVLKSFRSQGGQTIITFKINGVSVNPVSVSPLSGGGMSFLLFGDHIRVTGGGGSPTTPIDLTLTFATFTATSFEVHVDNDGTGSSPLVTITELQLFTTTYFTTGKFISRTLDYLAAPFSYGNFMVTDYVPPSPGTTLTYFTQSSADGITWDPEVVCSNGVAIASTIRRYLRWGAYFGSTGAATASFDIVYFSNVYYSVIFEVVDAILSWKTFEATYANQGGTILFFYRTATTSGAIPATAWTAISPGSDIISSTANHFVQFKIEEYSGDITREPYVDDITINWIAGTAGAVTSNQLVHAITWEGRYWFDAAETGFTGNNVVVIRGRLDYDRPWFLKRGWNILSFLIFNDNLYAGSSVDGKIYRLESGFSLAGAAMDSYFETGDLLGSPVEYHNQLFQVDIDYEKMGTTANWPLMVGVSTDHGATWDERAIALAGTGRLKHSLNIMKRGYHFRFRLRTNGIDNPWIVHGLFAFYRPTLLR